MTGPRGHPAYLTQKSDFFLLPFISSAPGLTGSDVTLCDECGFNRVEVADRVRALVAAAADIHVGNTRWSPHAVLPCSAPQPADGAADGATGRLARAARRRQGGDAGRTTLEATAGSSAAAEAFLRQAS